MVNLNRTRSFKKYLVGHIDRYGRIIPIGFSKNWKHASEIAKTHRGEIFLLTKVNNSL